MDHPVKSSILSRKNAEVLLRLGLSSIIENCKKGEETNNNDGAHFGDLGNVYLNVDNRINVDISSDRISFADANNNILSRGMVLHADKDKGFVAVSLNIKL